MAHSNAQIVKNHTLNEILKLCIMVISGLIVAYGLSLLIAHDFLDGGVTGLAIMAERVTGLPLGLFLILGNAPFVWLAWKKLGRRTAVRTIVGIVSLAGFSYLLHHVHVVTDEKWLAFFFGGTLLGIGIGLAIRYGGALDGSEALAAVLADKVQFDIDELILFINFGVFGLAAFIVGLEPAIASLMLFFVVVSPLIGKITNTSHSLQAVQIITNRPVEVAQYLAHLGKKVAYEDRKVFDSERSSFVETSASSLYTIVSRIDQDNVIEDVKDIDPHAILLFDDISSHHGLKEHV